MTHPRCSPVTTDLREVVALALMNSVRSYHGLDMIGWDCPAISSWHRTNSLRDADAAIAAINSVAAALPAHDTADEARDGRHAAFWTHDDKAADVGHLYYFAPCNRTAPPYTQQRHVTAIIDIASDGTLAGVELIENMPPPPPALPDPEKGSGTVTSQERA